MNLDLLTARIILRAIQRGGLPPDVALELVEQLLDGNDDMWLMVENLLRHALAGDREHVREWCTLMHNPVGRLEKEGNHGH